MSSNQSEIVSLHDITLSANTGLDAIKRAPIVEFDSGIKCLRIQDISQSKKFEDWGFCEVNEKNFLSFQLKQNDIIIARTGETVGVNKIILSDLKSVFNNGLIRLRINPKKINPFYLFYNLQNIDFKNHINGVARGASTQPNLRIEALLDFKINLPTIDIQNKIAKILSSLDSKIELNWQTIKTLRELSKSLFLEICVPKNAEELQDNWVVSKLSEFVEIKNGYAFKGTDFIDNGIPVIKIKNVKAGRVILNNLSYVSREVADKAKRFLIKQNELLITMSGNRHDGNPETWVGKVGIFHRDGEYLLNQRVSILNIIDENKMSRYFLSELLSSEEFQSYFISNATSSGGQANISPDLIYNTEIIVPPIEQLHKFNKLAKEIYNKIFANELEVETLTTLRDTLLPRLIKGEIEI